MLFSETISRKSPDPRCFIERAHSPEGFLVIDLRAVEALYDDLMMNGFRDKVAFKHAHDGKPGYENVWREK